jgi:hemerythrin HHE cation binding domain-containing protein
MTTKRELRGIWNTLAEQHQQLAGMFEQVRAKGENRAAQWLALRTELLSHERGELREVVPVLRQYPELRAAADAHDLDAKVMERMVLAIDDLPIDSDPWSASFELLADSVLRHAAEEEQALFPKAQQIIGDDVSVRLDATFGRAQQQLAAQV